MVVAAAVSVLVLGACERATTFVPTAPAVVVTVPVPGPAGPQGAPGAPAEKGETGATGMMGADGVKGEQGKTGGDTVVVIPAPAPQR